LLVDRSGFIGPGTSVMSRSYRYQLIGAGFLTSEKNVHPHLFPCPLVRCDIPVQQVIQPQPLRSAAAVEVIQP
jgi:hypothetical protein